MSTPLTKKIPIWLSTQDENDVKHKSYKRSIRYFRALYAAWPDWASNHPGLAEVYREAKSLRANGRSVQVDHIIPICHPRVCGLHVPWNLQIMSTQRNLQKGNSLWPDGINPQMELGL